MKTKTNILWCQKWDFVNLYGRLKVLKFLNISISHVKLNIKLMIALLEGKHVLSMHDMYGTQSQVQKKSSLGWSLSGPNFGA